jgi:hypothetical protein
MPIGVRIEQARVVQDNGLRTLSMHVDPNAILSSEKLVHAQTMQRDTHWAVQQQLLATQGQTYDLASPEHPLRGFSVGMLPILEGSVLLVAKPSVKGAYELNAPGGFIQECSSRLQKLQLHVPVFDAARELAERVGIRQGADRLRMCFRDSDYSDFFCDVSEYANQKLAIFPSHGITNFSEKQTDAWYNFIHPVNVDACLRDGMLGAYLDTVRLFDPRIHDTYYTSCWHYWDSSISCINLIFPAFLSLPDGARPFYGKPKDGTSEPDLETKLAYVPCSNIRNIGYHVQELTLDICHLDGIRKETVTLIPGAFMKSIAGLPEWHD